MGHRSQAEPQALRLRLLRLGIQIVSRLEGWNLPTTVRSHVHCLSRIGDSMASDSELDRFQRWLQSRLADAEKIESKVEREKLMVRLQNAIQECIVFRGALDSAAEVADPFITRDSPVRSVSENEVQRTPRVDGRCKSCSADMAEDIEFCPLCGEFQ